MFNSIVLYSTKNSNQTMLTYKGYTGQIEVDTESKTFFGRVINIQDVITFQGETVEEACQAFKDSIDDYLDFCQELK